jgi:hypothetical protein
MGFIRPRFSGRRKVRIAVGSRGGDGVKAVEAPQKVTRGPLHGVPRQVDLRLRNRRGAQPGGAEFRPNLGRIAPRHGRLPLRIVGVHQSIQLMIYFIGNCT